MPLFAYKAIDSAGAENSGAVSAQSRLAALDEIARKGLTPVSVDEQAKDSARAGLHLGGDRVPQTVVEAFHRELANLLTAGVPIMRALSILCREDAAYPPHLNHIPDPPICLYVEPCSCIDARA